MKIRSLADNFFRADGQTDRRDEANSYISQFSENTQTSTVSLPHPGPALFTVPQHNYRTVQSGP